MNQETILRSVQVSDTATIRLIGGVLGGEQAYQTETEANGHTLRSEEFRIYESALEEYIAILEQSINSGRALTLTQEDADLVRETVLQLAGSTVDLDTYGIYGESYGTQAHKLKEALVIIKGGEFLSKFEELAKSVGTNAVALVKKWLKEDVRVYEPQLDYGGEKRE